MTLQCKNGHVETRLFDNITRGHGCSICKKTILSEKNKTYSHDYVKGFIDNLGYDWLNEDEYKNAASIIIYRCNKCGNTARANFTSILNGRRCRGCSIYKKKTTGEFISFVNSKTTDYEVIGEYKTCKDKLTMQHKTCGRFFSMTPDDFVQGHRCPFCSESHGENEIASVLDAAGIAYIRQYRFKDCRNVRPLPFDFYLPEQNVAIEFNGAQHYKSVDFWGGNDAFEYRKNNDRIKAEYCRSNNIPLISIPYWDTERIGGIVDAVTKVSQRK